VVSVKMKEGAVLEMVWLAVKVLAMPYVATVSEVSGNANVLRLVVGPETAKKPLAVPPLAPGRIPLTSVVRLTQAAQDKS